MRLSIAALLTAIIVVGVLACPSDTDCSQAPSCDGNRAFNCVDSCPVGPCSTGPDFKDCGELQCEVLPGDVASVRFSHARAACVNGTASCDAASSGQPQCDGKGAVTGCSAYNRTVTVSCGEAAVYFDSALCCSGIIVDGGSDAGTDAGTDAGAPDAGDGG